MLGKSMIKVIFGIVSFLASVVGAICGIGGGVIMKPVFDAIGVMDVVSISFLSGCTVLSMSVVSVGKSLCGEKLLNLRVMTPMAVGAVIGGLIGKWIFQYVKDSTGNQNLVGCMQAAVLLLVTFITLIYTLRKSHIKTFRLTQPVWCLITGVVLGIMSSFLGIGGGPINLMVLSFLFSMQAKEAAISSIYVILFSQVSSLIQTIATGTVPSVDIWYLVSMVAGGILGGIVGGKFNKKLDNQQVDKLFIGAMGLIILINIYNVIRFGMLI